MQYWRCRLFYARSLGRSLMHAPERFCGITGPARGIRSLALLLDDAFASLSNILT